MNPRIVLLITLVALALLAEDMISGSCTVRTASAGRAGLSFDLRDGPGESRLVLYDPLGNTLFSRFASDTGECPWMEMRTVLG